MRTRSMDWQADDRRRAEQGARHVRKVAELTARAQGGDAEANALLTRFHDLWREGADQWTALRTAEREATAAKQRAILDAQHRPAEPCPYIALTGEECPKCSMPF